MTYFVFSLFCSSLITFLIVRLDHLHSHLSADHDLFGVQKVHAVPVPRIGGIGIFVALVCTVFWLWLTEWPHRNFLLSFLVPSFLVFVIGLLEDLTKRVSVRMRLMVTMFAALIGCLLLNATVRTFGIQAVDTLFQINLIALVFTVVAVAGVANAVNLIDGFNGLSGGVCLTALLALAAVTYMVGDNALCTLSLVCAGAVAGFLMWNYPNAKIFLGDGGAYLVGFVIAELSVLLHERNTQVSVLFPLLLMIYPIFETLFSIYRRKFVRGQSPGEPDAMHLHQMINKRLVRWRVKAHTESIRSRGNSLTSPYLWVLNKLAVIPAMLFWNNSLILLAFIILFTGTYVWLYGTIVQFRAPHWLFLYRRPFQAKSTVAITSNTAWNVFNFRGGLIRALQNKGYCVIVYAPYDEYVPRLIEMGCQYFEVRMQNSGTNPIADFSIAGRYWMLLKKHRPVVLLTFTPKPNIYGALAAKLLKVPVITNISGLGRAFIKRNWITVIAQQLYGIALKHPSRVFFQNNDDKSIFLEMGYVKPAQVGLLPGSGVNTAEFSPMTSISPAKPFIFLLVARMLWDKGVGEFVQAAKVIKQAHPDVKFQLVGFLDIDNPSAVSRAQMDEWVNNGWVEYLGPTDNVRAYLSNADCVVLPSYREGTPRTLLEAASMALPIITTDAPGCRDTIDDGITGYLCQVKDVDSLANRMSTMLALNEEKRRSMGAAGRRKMEQQFNEKTVFDAYLNAIENIHPAALEKVQAQPTGDKINTVT